MATPSPQRLTIRFSTAHPDLDLDIPSPGSTSVAALRQLIRSHLPPQWARRGLRFIHQGRVLADTSSLAAAIRVVAPPPLPPPPLGSGRASKTGRFRDEEAEDEDEGDDGDEVEGESGLGLRGKSSSKGKGKDKMRVKGKGRVGAEGQESRTHVNCSVGPDDLSPAALQAESVLATTLPQDRPLRPDPAPHPAAAARPLGFSRLSSTGLSASEIAQLRASFRQIQETRFTPDTLPSPDTLLAMEDAWLDGHATLSSEDMPGGGGAGRDAGGGVMGGVGVGMGVGVAGAGAAVVDVSDGEFGMSGRLMEQLIWGMAVGFFWPVGCVVWLRREEGVGSWRWLMFVALGVLFSGAMGVMRGIAGDDG